MAHHIALHFKLTKPFQHGSRILPRDATFGKDNSFNQSKRDNRLHTKDNLHKSDSQQEEDEGNHLE
jgi:hypothetical protein